MKRMRLILILLLVFSAGYFYLEAKKSKTRRYVEKYEPRAWVQTNINTFGRDRWDDELTYRQKKKLIKKWKRKARVRRKRKRAPGITQKRITLPAAGTKIPIVDILNIIRTNSQLANFIVLDPNGNKVKPVSIGFNATFYAEKGKTFNVTLKSAVTLIDKLITEKRIRSKHKKKALRVWLYFQVNVGGKIYTFYVNDPLPGRIKRIAGRGTIYAAKMIMNRYN